MTIYLSISFPYVIENCVPNCQYFCNAYFTMKVIFVIVDYTWKTHT